MSCKSSHPMIFAVLVKRNLDDVDSLCPLNSGPIGVLHCLGGGQLLVAQSKLLLRITAILQFCDKIV